MKSYWYYSAIFILLMGCGSQKVFTEQENEAYKKLQQLVDLKSFEIISSSAVPMASASFSRVANSNILGPGNNASHIDISSNSNKLVVKGDTITGFLPYFGEQNFGGHYGGNHTGIEFDNVAMNYEVNANDQKHSVDVGFRINDLHRSGEHYTVLITLYPNLRSTIRVQSTSRTTIEYLGRVIFTGEINK